jgi:hypothetical protein
VIEEEEEEEEEEGATRGPADTWAETLAVAITRAIAVAEGPRAEGPHLEGGRGESKHRRDRPQATETQIHRPRPVTMGPCLLGSNTMTIAVAIGITVAVAVEDAVEEEGLEELFRVVVEATDHVDKTLHTPIGNRATCNKKHSCNMRRIDFWNMIITAL